MPHRSNAADAPAHAAAERAGLHHVSDTEPGIRRRRAGRGFAYRWPDGRPVRDAATLARIRALAIPPAYTEVWICREPHGHLQATGRDARGRKQYRYHRDWSAERSGGKFGRLPDFARALPRLRRRLRTDLARDGFPQEKVLALVVALLADTLLRVGNDAYARSNRSYGLSTLRNRHLEFVRGGRVRLRFRGKSGQEQEAEIDDRRLVRLIRRCRQLPGQALFQYRDDDGVVRPVDSGQLNDYLRQAMGGDFTAKDFRTWGGTVAALRQLARTALPAPASKRALAAVQAGVIADVAARLGNTPAVCRKAYIDPCVFEGWREGRLAAFATLRGERQWEQAALRFLRAQQRRRDAQPQ